MALLICAVGMPLRAATAENGGTPAMSPAALPIEGTFPALRGATGWLNSQPLRPPGLRGKVVLVEFWTYTCVNWRRTLPYVNAWAEKYGPHGLVVIGVHSPEFSFEHDVANVRQAAKEMKITFPIAIDNDFAVWRAFKNEYWPALYFIDAQGRIRHHQFGEGDYARSETVIRTLLTEAGFRDLGPGQTAVDARGLEAPADFASLQSPESYVGYARAENFASPGGVRADTPHVYGPPAQLALNAWSLSGNWTMGQEAAVLNAAGGSITFGFHARDLNLVLAPPGPGRATRFRVRIDGRPPGAVHGTDVTADGDGTVSEPRLYQLIRQRPPIADHLFEIEFLDAGARVYDFTFG